MIDDSDVFSIQPDRNRPQRVIAGACSGIHRSLSGGATWSRPVGKSSSYRTYVIAQDPRYENVWYAGTTHGTIRSPDGGSTWTLPRLVGLKKAMEIVLLGREPTRWGFLLDRRKMIEDSREVITRGRLEMVKTVEPCEEKVWATV
jgi:hypothetical protein